MSYFGTEKPILCYGSEITIDSFADYSGTVAGTVKATCSAAHNLTSNDYVFIYSGSTGNYDGYLQITVVDADEFYFTETWAGTETASARLGWNLQDGNHGKSEVQCYYVPGWAKDRIINESPINGHITATDKAATNTKGRYQTRLEFYNLDSDEMATYLEIKSATELLFIPHADNLDWYFLAVPTVYEPFNNGYLPYPLADCGTIELISTDYEIITKKA